MYASNPVGLFSARSLSPGIGKGHLSALGQPEASLRAPGRSCGSGRYLRSRMNFMAGSSSRQAWNHLPTVVGCSQGRALEPPDQLKASLKAAIAAQSLMVVKGSV